LKLRANSRRRARRCSRSRGAQSRAPAPFAYEPETNGVVEKFTTLRLWRALAERQVMRRRARRDGRAARPEQRRGRVRARQSSAGRPGRGAANAGGHDRAPAAELPADRAGGAPAPQRHGDDHAVGGKPDVADARAGQAQQPVQCRGDGHAVLLANAAWLLHQQHLRRAAARRCAPGQAQRRDRSTKGLLLSADQARPEPTQTTGDPEFSWCSSR
jgi:hypothetical protein